MSLERPVEIELKYRVNDPLRGEELLSSGTLGPFRAAGSAPSLQFEDRYLDTRDGALARAGFAARLRHSRSLFIVTVKSLGRASGALQRRTELEGPATESPVAADWPPSPARSLILELCGDAVLEERVTIRQQRRRRRLVAGTAIVELSLDDVEVMARGEVVERFLELEAELLSGDEDALHELRDDLDVEPGLSPAPGSKLEAAIEAIARYSGENDPWANAVLGLPTRFVEEQGWQVPSEAPAHENGASEAGDAWAPAAATVVEPAPDGEVAAAPELEVAAAPELEVAAAPELEVAQEPELEVAPDSQLERASDEPGLAYADIEPAIDTPEAFGPPPETFATPEAFGPPPETFEQPAEVDLPQLATDLVDMESELVDSAVPPWLETEAELGFGDEVDLLVAAPEEEPLHETVTAPEEEPAEAPSPIEPPLKFPGVTANDAIAEAGRKVLKFHFLRLVAREPGTRSGKDPEDLHAMRVATRRLRAAWRVFGDAYKGDERKRQVTQLREVATRLGAVRDLDVLLLGLDEYREPLPERERTALEPLAAEWRRRRDAARTQLMRELDSPDYQRFLTDLRTFVTTPGAGAARTEPTVPHRVRDTAASRVWSAYEQVRAFEPILRWADVTTLHELRIRAKWLRYSMEFIREALGPETPLIIGRVVALQDHLGLMNDAEVATLAARTFLIQRASRLTEPEEAAIGRYLVSRERDVARLRQNVLTPWRGVASPQFRRALGRAIATL